MNDIVKSIQNHRSIRSYLDKDVSQEVLDEILISAQSMPSSINAQHTSVIVVRDTDKKAKISELAGGQPWIAQAPVFLVFVMDFHKAYLAGEKTGKHEVIHESIEGTMAGTFDSGIAMGAAIIAAESLGLGIVPIGGIRNNPGELIKLLDLPERTYPIAGLVVGYATDNSHKKPRLPFETFKHNDKYNKEVLKPAIDKYDEEMAVYLKKIHREQEINWSNQTSEIYRNFYYPKVYPTMKAQGFKNDK